MVKNFYKLNNVWYIKCNTSYVHMYSILCITIICVDQLLYVLFIILCNMLKFITDSMNPMCLCKVSLNAIVWIKFLFFGEKNI